MNPYIFKPHLPIEFFYKWLSLRNVAWLLLFILFALFLFISVTRLDQRLRLPEFQPSLACDLWPVRKQLHVRRSLRCRVG